MAWIYPSLRSGAGRAWSWHQDQAQSVVSRYGKISTVCGRGIGEGRKAAKNSSKTTKKRPGHWRRVRLFGMFWGVGGKRWREKCGERVNLVVTDLKIEGMKWKSTGGMPPSLQEFGGWWNITILCGGFKKSKPSWHIFFKRVAEAAPRWNSSFRKRKWRTAKKCLKASTTTGRRSLSSYDVVWWCLMKATKGNDSLIMTVQCSLQEKD